VVKGGTRVRLDSYFLLKKNKLITLFGKIILSNLELLILNTLDKKLSQNNVC